MVVSKVAVKVGVKDVALVLMTVANMAALSVLMMVSNGVAKMAWTKAESMAALWGIPLAVRLDVKTMGEKLVCWFPQIPSAWK